MAEERSSPQRRVSREGVLFAAICVAGAIALAWLHDRQSRHEIQLLRTDEENHVLILCETAQRDFRSILSDLRILAGDRALLSFIDAGPGAADAEAGREAVVARLADFCRHRRIYDQVRYIDANGREVVRVDLVEGRVLRAPAALLQNKANRYYFEEISVLGPEDVFMSPFDLNVEHGVVEVPEKPTIRFGTPVFDSAGRRSGFVILNYLGRIMLEQLDRVSVNATGRVMLLNEEGYFLHGGQPDDAWAFMYRHRHGRTFERRFPDAWEQVSAADAGQVLTPAGLFTFRTLAPIDRQGTRRWKAVSHVAANVMGATGRTRARWLVAAWFTLAVVAGFGTRMLARARADREAAQDRTLRAARLAAIGEAMAGLAHESRNAIQRSQACLEMLSSRVADKPGAPQLIEELQRAQDDLHRLYEGVREWAAPMTLRHEPCDVHALVRESWTHLGSALDHRVTLEEPDATVNATVSADRFALRHVLRNVLENAIIACGEVGDAPAKLTLGLSEARLAHRRALAISIRDTGPGFNGDDARRAFEPFFTTRTRGTGLGLAIARRIVGAHGGTIEIRSSSSGAEVVITLPREVP